MRKKWVSVLLTAAMSLSLVACGSSPEERTESNSKEDETFNIKMQIVTFGQEFPGLADVEAAINEITESEIGATVTLDPIAAWDLPSTSSLAITSNEEIDLMCILPMGSNMDSITNYTTKNMLLPLDDLYEAYKAAKGDGYYSIAGFADGDLPTLLAPTDDLGSNAVGSLMNKGLDDTTVVNKFATEKYKEVYDMIREWYNAGYINPDVISITDTWSTLLSTGQYLGAFVANNGSGMDGMIVNEQSIGQDLTVIRFEEDVATTTVASYGLWGIPVTCSNPEKTMQFLNMMYQNDDPSKNIANILSSGLEGVTYQVVETLDDGRLIIDYADGVDRMTAPYAGQVPIYGDALRSPKYTPVDEAMFDEMLEYNDTIKYSKAFGYSFDTSAYANQIAAINNVLETYRAQLAWGTVDVDTVLPQFLTELEAAGINDVIAANQEQLDAWLAEQ